MYIPDYLQGKPGQHDYTEQEQAGTQCQEDLHSSAQNIVSTSILGNKSKENQSEQGNQLK